MDSERRYHHGDLREALLKASEELLEVRGLDGFTLREAARRAGVSPAAPKHHFGDVKGVLTEIAIGGFDRLAAGLEEADRQGGGTSDRLHRQGLAYIGFAMAHPARFDLMFRRSRLNPGDSRLLAAAASAIAPLQRLASGLPRLKEADGALLIWSTVHGFARLALDGQFDRLAGDDLPAFIEARMKSAVASWE
ncbi:MAG TPA: TetR/AcrR family transcriptional regulator [Allosphingosinicella sp.]